MECQIPFGISETTSIKRDNAYSIKEMDLTLRAKLSKTNKQKIFQLKYVFILPAMDRTPCNTVFLSNCS